MKPQDYIDRLSTHLKQVIAGAIGSATAMNHAAVTPLHLLLALSEEEGSVGLEILKKLPILTTDIEPLLKIKKQKKILPPNKNHTVTTTLPELNSAAKQSIEKAMLLAYEHEHTFIGTEHLLYGLVAITNDDIEILLQNTKTTSKQVKKEVFAMIESTNKFPEMTDIANTIEQMQDMIDTAPPKKKKRKRNKSKKNQSALETYSVELTNSEHQKKIDPVIGRKDEIERMIHILARRTKNNPVLVGEPGVGKTALIEGLAKRIVEEDVPSILRDKRIYALDLTLLISGTIYRGEFESRIKDIMDEVTEADDIILFIDEIHNIIGAGSNQGTMDAANILKPALARGDLHCIGATTHDEYQKYISTDPALARRFQSIFVNEPSEKETIQILSGIVKYYNAFHEVTITKEAINTAVELSTKYIHDNFLPDKAIDLIDEAAAAVRVAKKPTQIDTELHELKKKWTKLQEKKETAIIEEEFDSAMRIKKDIENIETAMDDIARKKKKEKKEKTTTPLPKVTKQHVAKVLGLRIGQSAERLLEDDWNMLDGLPGTLTKQIIGQDSAIQKTVSAIKKGYLGITNKKRPIATLLYTGPSGVGKTKLAKELATAIYTDEHALIRLDMSEFAESHGVSKLLGSPAGYIGYNERNKFLDQIKNRPYSVVLFDEFDKAHRDVKKLLLQILDEGFLTDSTGKKISFTHTIIILTANTGSDSFYKESFGFDQAHTSVKNIQQTIEIKQSLRDSFGPELLGRLSDVCIFTPLGKSEIEQIIEKHVSELSTALNSTRNMSVSIDKKAQKELSSTIQTKHSGIRTLEQEIDTIIQNLVIEKLQLKKRKKSYTLTKNKQGFKLL